MHVANDHHVHCLAITFSIRKRSKDGGAVLPDLDVADAIVDRIPDRGRAISVDGPAIRRVRLGLDNREFGDCELQTISENSGQNIRKLDLQHDQEVEAAPMATTVAVVNMKGGVGESTVAVNLA